MCVDHVMFETQNNVGKCVAGNWSRVTVLAVPTLKLKNISKENGSAHRVPLRGAALGPGCSACIPRHVTFGVCDYRPGLDAEHFLAAGAANGSTCLPCIPGTYSTSSGA